MTIIYILSGIAIVATVLLIAQGQYKRHLDKIDNLVKKEAEERGLEILTFTYVTFKDWKNDPFDREIKIGTWGLYGIPTNRQYFRVLDYKDSNSDLSMTYWVKVTNNQRTKTLMTEWRKRA